MLTRRPRILSSRPRLDAVSPLPRLEATPPVTKTCLVRTGRGVSADVAKLAPVVCADGHCPSVHGVSEYQERPLLTWSDTVSRRRRSHLPVADPGHRTSAGVRDFGNTRRRPGITATLPDGSVNYPKSGCSRPFGPA